MASIEKRRHADGKTSYRAKIRLKGSSPISATFDRITDAKIWIQRTEAAIREGRYFGMQEAKRKTITDLVDRYLVEVLRDKSPSSIPAQVQQLNWWKSVIGYMTLDQVTPAVIAEHRDKLLEEPMAPKSTKKNQEPKYRSKATVVRYLAALSHSFTIAVKEWQWIDHNPVLRIRKPKEARGRDRYLTDEERIRLLEECKKSDCQVLHTIVVLALSTGMRRGEIMDLKWAYVDFQSQCIRLERTKNGDRRTVPLTGHALELLMAHNKVRRIDTQFVFSNSSGNGPLTIERPWRKAMKQAGVENFRFHDLRHSAASYLAMNGASLIEIGAVLGHRTIQMVKRYSHVADSHTHKVVAAMNSKIFSGV